MKSVDQIAVDTTWCPRCKVGPTSWCRTTSGNRATYVHQGRTWSIYEGWRLGYFEGLLEAAGEAARKLDPDRAHADIYADIEAFIADLRRYASD